MSVNVCEVRMLQELAIIQRLDFPGASENLRNCCRGIEAIPGPCFLNQINIHIAFTETLSKLPQAR